MNRKLVATSLSVLLFLGCVEQRTPTENNSPKSVDYAEDLNEILGSDIIYDWAERSFSPMYSNIGLVFDDYPGFLGAYFHYNYKNRVIARVINLPDTLVKTQATFLGVKQVFSRGEMN